MKISVVIPTYNRKNKLFRALQSVRNQTMEPDEVIVVDDGSIDNTESFIKNLCGSWPELKYIYQSNQGPGAARNTGIRAAKGDYVAFLDSDDEWYPAKLEKQVSALDLNPMACLCFSDTEITFHNTKKSWKSRNWDRCGRWFGPALGITRGESCLLRSNTFAKAQLQHGMISSPTQVLLRREHLIKYGGFHSHFRLAEDYELWLRLSLHGDIYYLDEELAHLHVDNDSTTQVNSGSGESRQNMKAILSEYVSHNLPSKLHQYAMNHLFKILSSEIWQACKHLHPKILRNVVMDAKKLGWRYNHETDPTVVYFASHNRYFLACFLGCLQSTSKKISNCIKKNNIG